MALSLLLMLSGCDYKSSSQQPILNNEVITIEHEQGSTRVPINPGKVIVFNIATLDTMDALGIVVAGLPKTSSHLPNFLKKYANEVYINAGTLFEPDYEKLNEFTPDIIIAGGRSTDAYDKLSEIAPTVSLSVDSHHFMKSLTQRIMQLGKIFNKEDIAEKKLAQFKQKIADVKAKAANKGTALVIMVSGGKMSTYGPGSRFGFVFDELGFKPAIALGKTGQHGNIINAELLLTANPDWLFVIDRDSAIGNSQAQSAKQVLDNQLIRKINAMQQQQVIYLDSTAMYIAGGLQTYSCFLDQLNKMFDKVSS